MSVLAQRGVSVNDHFIEQTGWEADVAQDDYARNVLEPLTRCPAVASLTWRRECGGTYAATAATWREEPDLWRLSQLGVSALRG